MTSTTASKVDRARKLARQFVKAADRSMATGQRIQQSYLNDRLFFSGRALADREKDLDDRMMRHLELRSRAERRLGAFMVKTAGVSVPDLRRFAEFETEPVTAVIDGVTFVAFFTEGNDYEPRVEVRYSRQVPLTFGGDR